MLVRQLTDLPVEIIQLIAWMLAVEEAKKFSYSSTKIYAMLDDTTFFLRRLDFREKMHLAILDAVKGAINGYLLHDKLHPGYKISFLAQGYEFLLALSYGISNSFMMFSMLSANSHVSSFSVQRDEEVKRVRYDQGYHRAHCLRHITNNTAIPVELTLFAIHTFLHETNGTKLKQRLTTALAEKMNGKALAYTYLDNYIEIRFGVVLPEMREALLKEVHSNSYDEYAIYDSYQFPIKHSWKNFLESLEPAILAKNAKNHTA